MQYLIIEATAYIETINLYAEAFRPAQYPDFDGDGDWKQLDVCVLKGDNEFLAAQIKDCIETCLGSDWSLTHFWIPEPSEEAPF